MAQKYLVLALKNVKRRGLRSWLTMLGIFIGIAAVVSLISLGDGLKTAVTGQFASMGTDKLTITNAETGFGPPGSTAVKKLTQHDVDIVESVKGVERVITRLIRTARIEYNKIAGYYYFASMPEDPDNSKIIYNTLNVKAQEGRLLAPDERGKIVLGNSFLQDNKFKKDIRVGSDFLIEGKKFEVVGILQKASTFQLNLVVLMNEKDMKDILNIGDEQDIMVALISKGEDIEEVGARIEEKLRKDRGLKEGEEDFKVQTPLQALQGVNTVLSIINIIIAGIAIVSLIVGGIGIANTMYTSVLERKKEIGVMKAIGAKNSNVLLIFLFEAGFLGVIGGLVGIIIGLAMAFAIASGANAVFGQSLFIINFSPVLIIGSLVFSLMVGIISGVFPALQASKLKPVEAFRG
jgi:putative ABC transport system permease protein